MAQDRKTVRPIIVIKKKVSHGGHHGGAWKVAYADFVTAMMSLFIVLWLMNSTPQIKKAVAGYFNDPKSGGRETGTTVLGSNKSVSIDQKNVQKLKEEIQKAILKQTDLSKLSKQIVLTITSEGLKIDLLEDKGGTFFQSGSATLSPSGVELLTLLAGQLKALPNKLLIEGYTDAQPFSKGGNYTNWELSADRANSARRLLQQAGVGHNQVSQVRGYGDQMLRVPSNPLDPTNRRVSLIVQWQEASASTADDSRAPETANSAPVHASATPENGPQNQASVQTPNLVAKKPAADGAGKSTIAPPDAASAAKPAPGLPAKPLPKPSPKTTWADRFKSFVHEKKQHS